MKKKMILIAAWLLTMVGATYVGAAAECNLKLICTPCDRSWQDCEHGAISDGNGNATCLDKRKEPTSKECDKLYPCLKCADCDSCCPEPGCSERTVECDCVPLKEPEEPARKWGVGVDYTFQGQQAALVGGYRINDKWTTSLAVGHTFDPATASCSAYTIDSYRSGWHYDPPVARCVTSVDAPSDNTIKVGFMRWFK